MTRRRGLSLDDGQVSLFERAEKLPVAKGSTASLKDAITQEVRRPVLDQMVFNIDGHAVEPIADPILARQLGRYDDWREYHAMDRDPAVFDAWRHVESVILNTGFEIQIGRSRTPAAKVLEKFAETLWERLPEGERQAYLMRSLDAAKWGWQPMQVLPDFKAFFNGQPAWLPRRVVEKPAHHFRWTAPTAQNPERSLLFLPALGGKVRVISGEELRCGWITPSYGSVNVPYGDHYPYQSAWILWEALRQTRKDFYQGLPRNFGMLKIKKSSLGVALATAGDSIDWDQLASDVKNLLELYHSGNVIIEAGTYGVEVLSDLNFIQSGNEAIESIARLIRLIITGETLTSDPGDRGTQALGTVHQRVRTDYALAMVASTAEPATSGLFRAFCNLNFGEVDPSDLPTFRSRLRLQVTMSDAMAAYSMGMPLRGGRLAELLGQGMASVIATDPADPETILKKPDALNFQDLLFPTGASDKPTNGSESTMDISLAEKSALTLFLAGQRIERDRGLTVLDAVHRSADSGSAASINHLLGLSASDSSAAASDALGDYVKSLIESFVAQRGASPDPKASPLS